MELSFILVVMHHSKAILKNSLAVSYKIKYTPQDLSIPFPGIYKNEVYILFVSYPKSGNNPNILPLGNV